MRITNSMMSNNILLNINKNTGKVNNLYNQLSTGKKIQLPSDNPIIASRALRFRNAVSEIEQYKKNVDQGTSWMEVTEQAFNTLNKITTRIRELITQGDGAETAEDKKKIVTEISSLFEEMKLVMNQTYAGRYIFSGLRTDEPGVFQKDEPDLKYTDITQNLKINDINKDKIYYKPGDSDEPSVTNSKVMKLAYSDATNVRVNGKSVTSKSLRNDPYDPNYNPYDVKAGEIVYIEETGELVFGEGAAESLADKDGNFKIEYDKSGFKKGDINPKVNFTCTDSKGSKYTMDNQNIEYEFGVGNRIHVNSLGKDVITDKMYGELKNFINSMLSIELSKESVLRDKYEKQGLTGDKLEEAIRKQMNIESQKAAEVMGNRFNQILGDIDIYASTISTKHTDLGARMNRLELIENRLEDDEVSFKSLLSKNEDTDMLEAIMLLKSAEQVYQASMQTGVNMLQISLANYL